MGPALIDTNLLLLLVVGGAGRSYIGMHKRLSGFDVGDFNLLSVMIEELFTDIVVIPHVLAEVSNLLSMTQQPARGRIRAGLAGLIEDIGELPVASLAASRHPAFMSLGLTDAALLCACETRGADLTLLTIDTDLAVRAEMADLRVQNFDHWRQVPRP